MKSLLYFIGLFLVLSCAEKEPAPIVEDWNFGGEWLAAEGGAGGRDNPESYKNFQLEFLVEEDNKPILILLTSPMLDVSYVLHNTLGEVIERSSAGRSVDGEQVLNKGKYRIVVMADRNAVGKFQLDIHGIRKAILPLPREILNSGSKNWGDLGGGGNALTPKNHMYTFEVTEDNAVVDIELASPDTDISLYIGNINGEIIEKTSGNRSRFKLVKFNKGTYYVMAGSHVRGSKGGYTLNVYGKVKNLKQITAKNKAVDGVWQVGNDTHTFELEVTEDNSLLDVELTSTSNLWLGFEVVDSKGVRVITRSNVGVHKNLTYTIVRVQKGKYNIISQPGFYSGPNAPRATFKVNAVGQIK